MNRRRRRPVLRVPESIEGVIDRAGEDRFARRRSPIRPQVWSQAVGGRIADRAKPVDLVGGVLLVRVATSVWAHELSLLAPSLISRLRDAGVDVVEMRFRVGEIEPPARPPERRESRRVPPPAPLPRELAANLAAVEDVELKEVLALAASANLAWQDYTAAGRKPPRGGNGR